jgi:hypothetical protein
MGSELFNSRNSDQVEQTLEASLNFALSILEARAKRCSHGPTAEQMAALCERVRRLQDHLRKRDFNQFHVEHGQIPKVNFKLGVEHDTSDLAETLSQRDILRDVWRRIEHSAALLGEFDLRLN